ncbi:chemotaxis protein [Pseudoduganella chitinolytica]|uniref:Chemotaxis protein n=1 Tax=Pseudoduganella chitinolytica TaxID=34070 RepID=A0ABY8BHK8_9BURK|nr:chemotaxis protein [Pseudoduganella chitinolytica]WEF33774.1 chemotaxis protein [Pseudoduganella chitinolytica]
MNRKKILGSHVKRMLSGVSDHGKQHLSEVETDLLQTNLLLEEAIEKLSRNFMAIHDAVNAQQTTIRLLLDGGTPSAEDRAKLEAMNEQVSTYVNAAITSMQFQDMTSQLIDRTLKRVTGLREFLATLGTYGAEMDPESDNEAIVDLLGKVSMALAIQSLELRSVLRKAVSQKHLESGDIELF